MTNLFNPKDDPTTPNGFEPNSTELTYESDSEHEVVVDENCKTNIEKDITIDDSKRRPFQSINPTSKLTIELSSSFKEQEQEALLSPRKVLYTIHSNNKETDCLNLNELSENLRFSVNNKLYADVMFRVGPTMQIVYAHRIVLTSNSTYFHSLFNQQHTDLNDKSGSDMIKLDKPDLLPDIFIKVLEYIYTGVIRLKQDDVLEILALSEEFGISTLKEMCSKFIQPIVDIENSCTLLEFSSEFKCFSLESFCFKFIEKNINRILGTVGFMELSEKSVIQIIQRDELRLTEEEEIDMFHSIFRWSKNLYIPSKGDSPEIINKVLREISKNLIVHCRFPLMTSEQLSSIVEPTNFVPKDLLFEAYKFHLTKVKPNNENARFRLRDNSEKFKKMEDNTNVTQRNPEIKIIATPTKNNASKKTLFESNNSPVKKNNNTDKVILI